jgi:hypothetical protein
MKPGILAATMLAVTAVGACVHDYRKDPDVVASARKQSAWVTRLPPCGPEVLGEDFQALSANKSGTKIAVRGLLGPGLVPSCTRMSCSSECCNGCSVRWVLRSLRSRISEEETGGEVVLYRDATFPMLAIDTMDCKVSALRDLIAPRPVIVTGTYEHDGRRLIVGLGTPPICAVADVPE